MSWKDLVLRLRAVFLRRRMDEELQEELQFHIEMQAQKNRRHALDHAEAKRQARLQFGSFVRATEECREQKGISFVEILAKDLHFAFRMLRSSSFRLQSCRCAFTSRLGPSKSTHTAGGRYLGNYPATS